ncbi:outer membrane lipoprotein [Teichococcus aestuarii]|uniref:17 kDa surface antigen n=2 Tax=Teichococcus aestuarii TaxID=568898 RepID=A0A2U1V1J4_9PROT|nr:hypothetical protein [Pseudoroseomonas aestuarii]PWC27770.1 hypothetical protein CR165_15840 [Pseudoroseomonas aestuarii]
MTHAARTGLKAIATSMFVLAMLAACSPSYSPDTYASRAVQQANKVEQGVVVGRRQIEISADGTTGAVTGAAAGGVVGTRVGGGDITSAFAGIGGGLLGGLLGTAVEKGVGSSPGFEYVVRKPNGELVSVTQRDETPLAIGQKVLVIAGAQARIVPDYTVPNESPPGPAPTADGTVPPAPAAADSPAAPATAPLPAAPLPAAPAQESLPPPQQAPAEAPAEAPAPAPLPAPATLPARPELPGVPQLAI